jgi:hypothetical protein
MTTKPVPRLNDGRGKFRKRVMRPSLATGVNGDHGAGMFLSPLLRSPSLLSRFWSTIIRRPEVTLENCTASDIATYIKYHLKKGKKATAFQAKTPRNRLFALRRLRIQHFRSELSPVIVKTLMQVQLSVSDLRILLTNA